MNAYFEKEAQFDTNKRIIEAYFTDTTVVPGHLERGLQAVLTALFVFWKMLTGTVARRIFKASGVALSLIGMVGIIGAMERGTLSLLAGLLIGAVLIGIEYLCLRPRRS